MAAVSSDVPLPVAVKQKEAIGMVGPEPCQLGDQLDLVVDQLAHFLRHALGIAPGGAGPGQLGCPNRERDAGRSISDHGAVVDHHVRAEAHGPVVLQNKGGTWTQAHRRWLAGQRFEVARDAVAAHDDHRDDHRRPTYAYGPTLYWPIAHRDRR